MLLVFGQRWGAELGRSKDVFLPENGLTATGPPTGPPRRAEAPQGAPALRQGQSGQEAQRTALIQVRGADPRQGVHS